MERVETPVISLRNLKMYFPFGRGKNKFVVKAIDDVSFDIYKGEVFGLVGESGCGKTTTGRTIIKLYQPTDGEVYFLGQRISAGLLGNKDAIRKARKDAKEQILELKHVEAELLKEADESAQNEIKATYKEKIKVIKEKKSELISIQRKDIRERNKTQEPDYDLMKNMQMIFQDPIESLNPRMTVKEIIAEGLRIAGERNGGHRPIPNDRGEATQHPFHRASGSRPTSTDKSPPHSTACPASGCEWLAQSGSARFA